MEHIRQFPGRTGDIPFDGVGQGVHTGGGRQALRHGGHHIRVHDRDHGDVVRVHAYEFTVFLHVGDDVVDGDFRGRAGGRRNSDDRHRRILGFHRAFQTAHVLVLRIADDDADGLGRVHRGTAADGHDAVGARRAEGLDTGLYVFNGGVRFDLGIQCVREVALFQQIGDLLGHTEADKVRVGADEGVAEAPVLQFGQDVFDRALAVIGCFIQYKTVRHGSSSFCYTAIPL